MRFDELRRNWDALGTQDPLWAILSEPEKRGNKWDLDEFFASGRSEVAELMARCARLGRPLERAAALDFGCGVGRITQALVEHFGAVTGVDVAASMIEQAQQLNRHGERCRYVLNEASSLEPFGDESFDLVYTKLVLQHMHPRYALRYLLEFERVLRPGGMLLFQMPGDLRPRQPIRGAYRARVALREAPPARVSPGEYIPLRARVRNASLRRWPADDLLRLGNRWYDAGSGELVVSDDARVPLPARGVWPGGRADLELAAIAPARPGRYRLELDMVHEHVTWFSATGRSRAAEAIVEVHGEAPPAAPDGEPEPEIQMYGVAPEIVTGVLRAADLEVLEVSQDSLAGLEFRSYTYICTK
jgi:SAM-dependent methyltransferase